MLGGGGGSAVMVTVPWHAEGQAGIVWCFYGGEGAEERIRRPDLRCEAVREAASFHRDAHSGHRPAPSSLASNCGLVTVR